MRTSHVGPVPVVLVVDDHDDVRELLTELLAHEAGCSVQAFVAGREALTWLRAPQVSRPCLLVLDWMMPDMDGAAVLAELRRDPALAAIPVVVFSGGAHDVEATGVRVLHKSRDLERLVALVCERCDAVRSAPAPIATPQPRRGNAGGHGARRRLR